MPGSTDPDRFARNQGAMERDTTDLSSPDRSSVEAFIADRYRRLYDADLCGFLPNLVACRSSEARGAFDFAFGYQGGGAGPLFLESYLDHPVESGIHTKTGLAIPRERVVEIGNLAIAQGFRSARDFLWILEFCRDLGFDYVVCTTTRVLRFVFHRLGAGIVTLGTADPARVAADGSRWGRYYDSGAVVVAGHIGANIDAIRALPARSKAGSALLTVA